MCGHDANDAEGNKSINTKQLASITINDWDNSLLPNITIASCDSEPIGNKGQNMQTIDKLHAVNSSSNDESVQVTAVGYDIREFKFDFRYQYRYRCLHFRSHFGTGNFKALSYHDR